MSSIFGQNAIGWGHLQLRGGLRSSVLLAAAYAIGISGFIYVTVATQRSTTGSIPREWASVLLVFQTFFLGVLGTSAIAGALRQDLSGGMLYSHRLMPIQPHSAVLGYLLGAPSRAIALGLANFIIGLAVCRGAHIRLEHWIVANAILAVQAMFLWSMMLCLAFLHRGAFWGVFFVLAVGPMSNGLLFGVFPASMILISVFMNWSIFSLGLTMRNLTQEFAIAIIAQLAVAGIFFVGSMRKYRRPEQSALGVIPALSLLAAWVAMSAIATMNWDQFRPLIWRGDDIKTEVQFVASMLVGMLLAIVPIANSARDHERWRKKLAVNDPAGNPRPLPALFIALAAAGMLICLCKAAPAPPAITDLGALIRTMIVVGSFALGMTYLLRLCYRDGRSAPLLASIYIGVVWLAPFMIDLAQDSLRTRDPNAAVLGVISTASPIGSLVVTWFGSVDTTVGLGFQCMLAMAAVVVFYATDRRAAPAAETAVALPPPLPPLPPAPPAV